MKLAMILVSKNKNELDRKGSGWSLMLTGLCVWIKFRHLFFHPSHSLVILGLVLVYYLIPCGEM